MNRQTGFRVVMGLIVLAVLAAAGFALFNAGAAYGVAQSPEWARLAEEGVRPGGMGPWMMRGGPNVFGPHMGYGWGRGFGWGFGFLNCLFPLLFFFLVFALFRGLFGWGRWGWRGGPNGWEHRGRERFEEWHKQAHGGGGEPTQPQQ